MNDSKGDGPPPERRASGIDRGIEGGRWQDGFRRSHQRVIALFGAARDHERSTPTQGFAGTRRWRGQLGRS